MFPSVDPAPLQIHPYALPDLLSSRSLFFLHFSSLPDFCRPVCPSVVCVPIFGWVESFFSGNVIVYGVQLTSELFWYYG